MKITAVRTATGRVPLERPTRIATRVLGGRDYVLAWIDTDQGLTGLGYTYAGTLGGRIVQASIEDALAPLLVGEEVAAIERHWARAIRFARAVEQYDPWWLEEPLRPDDVAGHTEIARALDVPVAAGEIHATRWDFRDLSVQKATDILQPDAGVLGGVSEWLKVAHTAASFDLPVAPHWHADIHVHLAGAVANCLTVEYFSLEEDIYNFERIIVDRLQPRDGLIQVPDDPGEAWCWTRPPSSAPGSARVRCRVRARSTGNDRPWRPSRSGTTSG